MNQLRIEFLMKIKSFAMTGKMHLIQFLLAGN